ncbi:hypothetical protein H6768_06575 [Candidatus Peribacteria bacterium]|nr:hypothetical protein [Candidatus Peribacteria bacterium]
MTTNKHTSTDLATTSTNEAKKAQEWIRANQSVKIGSKTVAGILNEVRTLISGTLNLAEKPGRLSNTQTDAIIGEIQKDKFAKQYIGKQLNHETDKTKKNILDALEMYYEIRAYLGLVSYMGNTLEIHGKKCLKIKEAFVT